MRNLCTLISFTLRHINLTGETVIRLISYIIFCFVAYSCSQSAGNNKHVAVLKTTSDFAFRQLSSEEMEDYSTTIKNYYDVMYANRGFNGSVLVAKNGEILFEDYKGIYNFQTKEPVTEHTPFHLASISKTFTAMAILKLWEQHRLSLDDSLQKFFPKLPYRGV